MNYQLPRYYTPEEYLALERAAEFKSEYLAGEIFAMAGTSENHNLIAGNSYNFLRSQFMCRPCRSYFADIRVRVAEFGMFTDPDVVALCGEREFIDAHRDTVLNPAVIVEVLSPSTEAYDCGAKFTRYSRLSSLTDYVLVAQDRLSVDHFVRQGSGWFLTAITDIAQALQLESLGVAIPVVDIYQDVEFR